MRMINNLKADPPKIINDLRHLVKTSMEAFGDKDFYTYKEHNEIKHYLRNVKSYVYIWEKRIVILYICSTSREFVIFFL